MKSIVSPSAIENVNNPAHVTLLTRIDGKPAGKTYALSDGKVGKTVADHAGRYSAKTLAIVSLDDLRAVIASLDPNQCLVNGWHTAAPSETYRIDPEWALKKRLHLPDDAPRPLGMFDIDGQLFTGRFKEQFAESGLLFLDRDLNPDMPAMLETADDAEYFAQLELVIPGISACERLAYSSSSNRVLLPDGSRVAVAQPSRHYWLWLDSAARLLPNSAIKRALSIGTHAVGLAFFASDKNGVQLPRTVFDLSTFSAEREIFDAPPNVLAPLRLAAGDWQITNAGGGAVAIMPPAEAEAAQHERATGTRYARTGSGGFVAEDFRTLTLDTVIELKRGAMTVRDWLATGEEKARCQAPFRPSTSWAALIRRTAQGCCVHDAGDKTYYLSHDAANGDGNDGDGNDGSGNDGSGNDGTPCPDSLDAALEWLKTHPTKWRPILAKAMRRTPHKISIEHALIPFRAIAEIAPEQLNAYSSKLALDAIRTASESLKLTPSLTMATIADARAHIQAAGSGLFLIRAAHGVGKTIGILKPISDSMAAPAVAITHRVSLVDALVEKLGYSHYQDLELHGSATPYQIAVCLNSIGKPAVERRLAACDLLLVDEIEHVIGECHNPAGTLKKTAYPITQTLLGAMRTTALVIGVDADLSDITANAIRSAGLNPIVIDVTEAAPDALPNIEFVSETSLYNAADRAVADGKNLLIATDSAKEVTRLEARTRRDGRETLAIHSRKGCATSGEAETRRFLSNVNRTVGSFDTLIYSPVIESGVSIEVPHFDTHLALYTGTIAPADFIQMIRRDRTAKTIYVAISGTGAKAPATGSAVALEHLAAVMKSTGEALGIDPGKVRPFDVVSAQIEARRQRALAEYARHLWLLLEARGYRVSGAMKAADAALNVLKGDLRDEVDANIVAAMNAAPILPAESRQRLDTAAMVTTDESAAMLAFDIRAAFDSAPDAEIAIDHHTLYNDGRLDRQIRRFDLAMNGATAIDAEIDTNDTTNEQIAASSQSFALSKANICGAVFAAINAVLEGGTIDAEGAMAIQNGLRAHEAALTHHGLARFQDNPSKAWAIRWLDGLLGKFGLWLDVADTSSRTDRKYRLGRGIYRDKKGKGRAVMPGWDLMRDLSEAKGKQGFGSGSINPGCIYKADAAAGSGSIPAAA